MQANSKLTFGIDGSFDLLSMAFFEGESVIDSLYIEKGVFSSVLVSAFDRLVKRVSINILDIGSIYVTNGPGRYTSLRVVLSFIKGLFYDFKGPIYCVNSIDLIAANYKGDGCIYIMKKTAKSEIVHYYTTYPFVQRIEPNSNCQKFDGLPDIKNLFKINKILFQQCSLSNIKIIY